jgi:hypothetical protein
MLTATAMGWGADAENAEGKNRMFELQRDL